MALRRLPDWPVRLRLFFDLARRTPFAWGIHDCALFACNGVREITGVDLATGFRGGYDTEADAMTAVGAFTNGGTLETLAELLAGERDIPPIGPREAQRGDVVLLDGAAGPTLGLCAGAVALFAAPGGTAAVPMRETRRAWKIGEL